MKILSFFVPWLITEGWGEKLKNSTSQTLTKGHGLYQDKVRQNWSNSIIILLCTHAEKQGINACAETHWAFILTLPYLWALVLLPHKWSKNASALKATPLKQQKCVYMGEGQRSSTTQKSVFIASKSLKDRILKCFLGSFRSAFNWKCKLIEMWQSDLLWVCDPRKPFLVRISTTSFYDYSTTLKQLLQ